MRLTCSQVKKKQNAKRAFKNLPKEVPNSAIENNDSTFDKTNLV